MVILRGLLGSNERFVGVLGFILKRFTLKGLLPQKQRPIISHHLSHLISSREVHGVPPKLIKLG